MRLINRHAEKLRELIDSIIHTTSHSGRAGVPGLCLTMYFPVKSAAASFDGVPLSRDARP